MDLKLASNLYPDSIRDLIQLICRSLFYSCSDLRFVNVDLCVSVGVIEIQVIEIFLKYFVALTKVIPFL